MAKEYYAQISWKDDKTPQSTLFDDVYYSIASGPEESNYVFIQHNNLIERFSKLQNNDIFIIGETGFGSGLNFLNVLNIWQNTVTSQAKLFFISFEKYPLSPTDLKKINFDLPNFEELEKQYYLPLPATHRLSFSYNVYLNLVIGDVNETLKEQHFLADAWFLDGFTPTRNNDMWNEGVFLQIARLCKPNATFATFTANSIVRKNLQHIGFHVIKDKGFSKREMLYGYLPDHSSGKEILSAASKLDPRSKSGMTLQKPEMTYQKPWFARYTNTNNDSHIIIIGGGISGAATAYSLARRGYKVTLYEQSKQLAAGASGNYQAILYNNFSVYHHPIQELSYSGYRYSHHLINSLLNSDASEYANCGLIQLGFNDKEIKSQLELIKSNIPDDFCYLVGKSEIERITGTNVNYDQGLYFPYGLWLNPQALVNKLVDLPNIKVVLECKIDEIIQRGDYWQLVTNGKILDSAANLILCNADSCDKFNVTKNLDLRKTRGQITIVKDNGNDRQRTILCGSGYIIPKCLGRYTIGATFSQKEIHTGITVEDNIQNIEAACLISDSFEQINPDNLAAQAAIRAAAFDYLPLVGPLANYEQFTSTYAKLAKDKNLYFKDECPYYKGLYLNVAHGSKGMLTAPFSGEIIADYIDNSPMPCSEKLRVSLHPNRLYIRELVKGL
ncbi:MAG: bifunctional tRNA (5-methylaminomethyl-2-thiouridine)(34)-methyltransferase MnmD/FAD-dependent [Burkholderiales bacterium]|jgi:tRNA 5-methylaminomethyl-2-thiouridine biosynthesis bifunctional protein|nr:bifunctional tRNA (5-methylaminomethyl-2-thiouridine)(34)-methyltransferase MnmD/FAD-dependent [Burkholderiales bacterium]